MIGFLCQSSGEVDWGLQVHSLPVWWEGAILERLSKEPVKKLMCHIYSIKLNKLNTATLGSCPDKYQPFLYCNHVQLLYTERTFYLIGMSTIMC